MAKLHSTGPHEPSALNYLISEGLLSTNPRVEDYEWTQQICEDDHGQPATQEVLRVHRCVVWSRNGTIKRVFNLDIEDEVILHAFATCFPTTSDLSSNLTRDDPARALSKSKELALVIILKTQVHIYCLSGAIHVIPLSFEVARALPFLGGCLLQPRQRLASKLLSKQSTASTSFWENASTPTSQAAFLFEERNPHGNADYRAPKRLPTYCITDLLSDIGLVQASYTRKPLDREDLPLLPSEEELLYLSTDGQISSPAFSDVCIAVTLNRENGSFTIWQVDVSSPDLSPRIRTSDSLKYRKRQSSNIHERSRVPSARVQAEVSRESFGGLMQSFVESEARPQASQLSNIENLAAELGQDFEPSGVQTRSAKRISSMLARTDLAPANDRSTYNDNTLTSRKSLSRIIRKEGSFGSVTDRNSFGVRRSLPANTSIYSNATSFLEPGDRLSIGEGLSGAGIDDPGFDLLSGRLERDVTFCRLKNFSCHETSTSAPLSNFRVMIVPHPISIDNDSKSQARLSVCVHESLSQAMTVVTVAVKSAGAASQRTSARNRHDLKAIQVQKGTNIADVCLVSDSTVYRLVILSKTSQGGDVVHLEAPWSSAFRIDLPTQYLADSIVDASVHPSTPRRSKSGVCRKIEGNKVRVVQFLITNNLNSLAFMDAGTRMHKLRIKLRPEGSLAFRVIQLCKFILPGQMQDSMLVANWEIARWLENQDVPESESSANLAVMLYVLAVPFINALQNKPATPSRRKKSQGIRLSGGPSVDSMSYTSMQAAENIRAAPAWTRGAAWTWMQDESNVDDESASTVKQTAPSPLPLSLQAKNIFSLRCADLARDFLQSPAGESMIGPEGYSPIAINQERNIRRTTLASIVVALYLLSEELKLQVLADESVNNDRTVLCVLIAQLSAWLNWSNWQSFMQAQLASDNPHAEEWVLDRSVIDNLDVPPEPFSPISIFEHIAASVQNQQSKFHTLVELVHNAEGLNMTSPLMVESAKLLPLTTAVTSLISNKVSKELLKPIESALLPEIIAVACHRAVGTSISVAPHKKNLLQVEAQQTHEKPRLHYHAQASHNAVRDVRIICNQALDAESLGRWDASSEMDRQAVTKLIFNQDRRYQEASRLVNQARPPEIEYEPQPNWTEADTLEAQKLLTQYATRRTFAVVSGRGMMHFNARMPLLTEMVPRAQFSMQCLLRSRTDTEGAQSMTFSADRSQFTEDKVSWAFFHNGVSAGLMISKEADFIDTSWILYNKPPELSNRHAGFLLSLGLNGHLKTLAKWVAFKYLTPKHTMTSVGLLLGLAASYIGTADTLITRLLSVHVTCLLPPGAAELNLSTLTQTTGIVGIGLLYHDCQHRRMSEVMLSEIECREPEEQSGDEPILRDEGYRLAAGMSLGLINLGYGMRLNGLHDMRVVERLLAIAVGTKNVNLVHVLDRATAGAVIATAFIFMKTNDVSIACKIDIPDTIHQFDYVRPDVFLLRTLARHLIMWGKILPTTEFVRESLPKQYAHRADLASVKRLVTNDLPFFHVIAGICFAIALRYAGSQRQDARDLLVGYLDQFLRLSRMGAVNYDAKVTINGIRNCLDILALSCATVMAGSGDLEVYRRLRALHGRTDKETPFGSHLAAHMAIGALFLSGGTATFGSSKLAVAALVIAFYPLFPVDPLDNKAHLQALRHLWVLAVEHRCLVLRDAENGQVLGHIDVQLELNDGMTKTLRAPSLLPELDTIKTINISSENFWPVQLDLDAHVPAESFKTASYVTTHNLRETYKSSSTGINISLHRRALYDKPNVDAFEAEMGALDQSRDLPGSVTTSHPPSTAISTQNPLDWIFNLPTFSDLDHSERALVLHSSTQSHVAISADSEGSGVHQGRRLLDTTPIDTALSLNIGTLGPENIDPSAQKPLKQDKLWQLKVLLAFADKLEQEGSTVEEGGDRRWLRSEVIEKLRWRVWRKAGGEDDASREIENEAGNLLD